MYLFLLTSIVVIWPGVQQAIPVPPCSSLPSRINWGTPNVCPSNVVSHVREKEFQRKRGSHSKNERVVDDMHCMQE